MKNKILMITTILTVFILLTFGPYKIYAAETVTLPSSSTPRTSVTNATWLSLGCTDYYDMSYVESVTASGYVGGGEGHNIYDSLYIALENESGATISSLTVFHYGGSGRAFSGNRSWSGTITVPEGTGMARLNAYWRGTLPNSYSGGYRYKAYLSSVIATLKDNLYTLNGELSDDMTLYYRCIPRKWL